MKFLANILVMAFLFAAALLYSDYLVAEECYFADALYWMSEIEMDARKDSEFDKELIRRGMSPSAPLFQAQPARTVGAYMGKCYEGDRWSIQHGPFIVGGIETKDEHPEFGVYTLRGDTLGYAALVGYKIPITGSVTAKPKFGLNGSFSEYNVHSFVTNEKRELIVESHESIKDFNTGLVLGFDLVFRDRYKFGCLYLKDFGDTDTLGSEEKYSCGAGVIF
ncbi:MAG: hypothetical protein DBP02_02125 [gamma proteobacterium symbiont of Ctena orbiculata]|nr:MAG: hypothetical protein DBP02_02125 [gamma proteobacterium symbiont of Ctena orbiculata]